MLKEALKHDTIQGKEYAIQEYDEPDLTVVISPNLKAPLGSLSFNMLEIMPFLPGSFNIEKIEVFSRDNLNISAQELSSGIIRTGTQRIILDEKTELGKIVLTIRLLYKNSEGKYLFGLKHLYLLEADFQDDSYVVVRADRIRNISYIYDDVVLKTQFGTDTQVSSTEYGITYYASFDGDLLDQELEVSTPTDLNYLAANIRTVFIRVPVTTSMTALTPQISTNTNS